MLSDEELELLGYLLEDEGIELSKSQIIPPRKINKNVPLSFSQQRLWLLNQLDPHTPSYNTPVAFRLIGRLNIGILEKCLSEIIKRHEVLRTNFIAVNGRPIQMITSADMVTDHQLSIVNCKIEDINRLADEEAQRPFDLAKGQLMRTTLFRLSKTEHILLLIVHHIIYDGWSDNILIQEISALYESFCNNELSPLAPLPVQYADYAIWQRQWIQDKILETQLCYWKKKFTILPLTLQLPTIRPRPKNKTFRGANCSFVIESGLSKALEQLGRQEDATLFITLLAAFKLLLFRYTQQTDIVVGTPIANRNQTEVEKNIGFFINTLALRTDLSGNPSFLKLLARVREVALSAYSHQDLPFEKIVEELQPIRDMSHTPLFQVMFILQTDEMEPVVTNTLRIEPFEISSGTAKFDITLRMTKRKQELTGTIEYSVDLFEQTTIIRMVEHFKTLISNIVAYPNDPIGHLILLSEKERNQLLVTWNNTRADYPHNKCIHQLFEQQVNQTPNAVALVCGAEKVSYQSLNRRVNRLAHYLRKRGVEPEVTVGIFVERSIEMIVGLLAVLKAGGAYVSLDLDYPKERLCKVLCNTKIHLLLTQARLLVSLPTYSGEVLCLDQNYHLYRKEKTANPEIIITPKNLAYIVYTSGSTGQPKGILTTHRSVVNYLSFIVKTFNLNNDTIALQLPAISYDASVRDIIGPLIAGGKVVLVSAAEAKNPISLVSKIKDHHVNSLLSIVPSMLRALLLIIENGGAFCGSVKLILSSGENLYWTDLKRVRAAFNDSLLLVNQYGPSECTMTSSYYPVNKLMESKEEGVILIGKPISNVEIYILDKYHHPVPIGIPGEIYIGGVGLARGYLNQSKLTANAFIPHPFNKEPHARLYKTRDMARYLPDGNIELLGRFDHQVKVRGHRVELGEIEAILKQHPSLLDAVVVAREHPELLDTRVIAYVVFREGKTPSTTELLKFLRKKLPAYMIPAAIISIPALPFTPNNKIDRHALPPPEQYSLRSSKIFIPARNSVEKSIANDWEEILGVEGIGIQDNFFELGGHSLLAAQTAYRLSEKLQIDLPLRTIFENPNVASLASAIAQLKSKHIVGKIQKTESYNAKSVEQILSKVDQLLEEEVDALLYCFRLESIGQTKSETEKDRIDLSLDEKRVLLTKLQTQKTNQFKTSPLSFAQQRLWFLDQLYPCNPAYHTYLAVHLKGLLDIPALEQSLNTIICRHEILRTTFVTVDGLPVQLIFPSRTMKLPLLNLQQISIPDKDAKVLHTIAKEVEKPFDLARDFLLRAMLLLLNKTEYILLLVTHHIIFDGWSYDVILEELSVHYEALSCGEPSPLPDLPIQYKDYVAWQQKSFYCEDMEKHLSYWKTQLHNSPASLHLPVDNQRPLIQTFRGARKSLVLSKNLSVGLTLLCHQEKVTLFMLLLTAFKVLLFQLTGQSDIVIGTPIADRSRVELKNLIGFCVNTLVLRCHLKGKSTFKALLKKVRDIALAAYEHQDLPFEKLVEHIEFERDPSRNPLFQVMFVFHNTPSKSLELAGLSSAFIEIDRRAAKFDLTLYMQDTKQGLISTIEYNTVLFNTDTVVEILNHFQELLKDILSNPDQILSNFHPFLSKKQPQRPIHNSKFNQQIPMTYSSHQPESHKVYTAPRDLIELQLTHIWENLLDIRPIGIRENFFDIGGHSLLAVHLMGLIQKKFKHTIPLSVLFEQVTIEHLANILRQETDQSICSSLIRIQPSGSIQPFFCVHPVSGNVLCYLDLARYLGSDQPFYGLQSPGLNDEQEPYVRIEDMATYYLDQIQSVQPQGPYLIGGWSFGGYVAFEMARQLTKQGRLIGLLALFDPRAPSGRIRISDESKKITKAQLIQTIVSSFGNKMPISVETLWEFGLYDLHNILNQIEAVGPFSTRRLLLVCRANYQALKSYSPQNYSGRITLFIAEEQNSREQRNSERSWRSLTSDGVDVCLIPGSHQTIMMEPQVQILADKLRNFLERRN